MASFVREVLSATGRLGEKEDFGGKAQRLRSRADDLKSDLRERIESRYGDFSASFAEVSTAVAQLDEVLGEVETLEHSINTHLKPGLTEAGKEAGDIVRQMRELSHTVQISNQIKNAYSEMEEANDLLDRKLYVEATVKLRQVALALQVDNLGIQDDADLVKALKAVRQEYTTAKEKVSYVLCKEWDEHVKISEPGPSLVHLKVDFVSPDAEDFDKARLSKLVQALHACDMLAYRQNKLGSSLMNLFVKHLLNRDTLKFDMQYNGLTIEFSDSKPEPTHVLERLEKLFLFMKATFGDIPLSSVSFLRSLGDAFSSQLVELIIKECLAPAVPTNKDELPKYQRVIQATDSLQFTLIHVEFLDKSSSLLDYAQNIDSTFANKRCQTVLAKARALMKQDLHVAVYIEEPKNVAKEELEETVQTVTNFKMDIDMDAEEELLPLPQGMTLNDGLFSFPKCQVSQSVLDVVQLVKSLLDEATTKGNEAFFAGRLLCTARNIVEMYTDVLPISHREALSKLPQISALAYNNCMFLAHECLMLHIPARDLPEPLNQRPITFADLVPRLRQVGVDLFLAQMRRQRDQLRTMLRDSVSGLGQLDGEHLLPPSSEKCLRQVLHQMNHLKNIWHNVLPLSVYRRSLGTILNTVAEEMVQKVVVLEDIAADAAVQICMLFSLLQDNGPELFALEGRKDTSKGDVIRYVRKWNRFKELILLLNASLREIEDRWAGGKGPLAEEFTPEEVKRLIRALFQNTDRRAGVLSRIK